MRPFSYLRKLPLAAIIALSAPPIAIWYFSDYLSGSVSLSLLLGWMIFLGVAQGQDWIRLFGPLLPYDLTCLARRPRYFVLRFLFASVLAIMLVWAYAVFQRDGANVSRRAADFAASYFYYFMLAQLGAVCILTPPYAAGAIAEEKERKTLGFLLATDLESHEIILGRWLARLANLALLLLAGLPILSFLQLVGGVDPVLLLSCYAAVVVTMISLGSLGILQSTLLKLPRDAIAATYFLPIIYALLASLSWLLLIPTLGLVGVNLIPVGGIQYNIGDLISDLNSGNTVSLISQLFQAIYGGALLEFTFVPAVKRYAIFHMILSALCLIWAAARLRGIAAREGQVSAKAAAATGKNRPPLREQPMLWKEIWVETGIKTRTGTKVVLVLLILATFSPLYFIWESWPTARAESINIYVRIVGALIACVMLLSIASRAATSVSLERERDTLDCLLMSPVKLSDILFAKWLGSIAGVRWGWLWLGSVYLVGILTGGLHPLAVPALIGAWLIYATNVSLIGLFFSVGGATTSRATTYTYLTVFFTGLGHWILWSCCCVPMLGFGGMMGGGETLLRLLVGFTPPLAMGYCLSVPMNQSQLDEGAVGHAMIGLIVWLVIAVVLWIATLDRFRARMGRDSNEEMRSKRQAAPG